MKMIILLVGSGFLFASCSKAGDPPAPASLLGTWTRAVQVTLYSPKNGGNSVTTTSQIGIGQTFTFAADGYLTITRDGVPDNRKISYTYSGTTLTINISTMVTVVELSAKRLVYAMTLDSPQETVTTTDTFTR